MVNLEAIQAKFHEKTIDGMMHNSFGLKDYANDLGYGSLGKFRSAIAGKSILDATAGFGIFSQQVHLDSMLNLRNTQVISVEPMAPFLNTIEHRYEHGGYVKEAKHNFVSAWTDEGLPFTNQTFDLIFDRNGFLLFYDPASEYFRRAFNEMRRVLKQRGEIRTAISGGIVDMDQTAGSVLRDLGFDTKLIQIPIDPSDPLVSGFILTKN